MELRKLQELRALSDLKFFAAQRDLHSILQEEHKIRAELEKLSCGDRGNVMVRNSLDALKLTAADVAWSRWQEMARSDCNIRLAKVLARKERFIMRTRRTFGALHASNQIFENQSNNRKFLNEKKEAETLLGIIHSLNPACSIASSNGSDSG